MIPQYSYNKINCKMDARVKFPLKRTDSHTIGWMNKFALTLAAICLFGFTKKTESTGEICSAENENFTVVSPSPNTNKTALVSGNDSTKVWVLDAGDLKQDQYLALTLQTAGFVKGLQLETKDLTQQEIQKLLSVYVTYDPMNPGEPIAFTVTGNKQFTLAFPQKYGAHVKLILRGGVLNKSISIKGIRIIYGENSVQTKNVQEGDHLWTDPKMPLEKRVESILSVMTPADKMELLREGWGIPGIPRLGIPFVNKVEAIHGFSYGSGATIFPQSIALGASWDKKLAEEVAMTIGDETVSANTKQCWSPVLDVAQDARWGRCEETYGEDPVLVSEIGGAWIKGYQSKGLFTTPKHFAGHGSPLGGRDSHDIGLSEREMREIALVPFRHVIKNYHCQSIMMAYSDFQGIPIAKSKELLQGILREEWGFDGFIVSDCGSVENLTSRKHYTALNYVEAANQALAAGIATNCGDTYNNPSVIAAAGNGGINMDNLDNVCRTLLRTMFRNGLFENNPCKPLNWNKIYPGWNSPEHKAEARKAAQESIVLLENKNNVLPLSKSAKTIAVIGPGADDLQPGDYTPKLQPGQLVSVLSGIKASIDKNSTVIYEKGCEFLAPENYDPDKAVNAALKADVTIMVLGDCSTSESSHGIRQTSGESRDYATLILPGNQEKLLEAVCATGKPVILVLQAGRPYNLSYASEHCSAVLVNWLPGQEGGPATADVLFGDYNPAGRLPMTFPRDVAQLPLYYNFKTSGRGYNYVDMPYYPLYPFGYGLSYTTFNYSNLKTVLNADGTVNVGAKVTNTGKLEGDEVVQLYVTDMYASVKTRVMELKDFTRIKLKPGESQLVSFILTPYQLSLLNDKMDRVVEPGEFKIMIGGRSPSYIAADQIKNSVGFKTAADGVNGVLDYNMSFSADFTIFFVGMEEDLINNKKTAAVKIKNVGTLTDAGKVDMFVDGIRKDEEHHYELDPGEEKIIHFSLDDGSGIRNIIFTTKYKSVAKTFGK
jgi:beta-glucosidase